MTDGFIDIGFELGGETLLARRFELADELARDMSEPLGELMDRLLDSVRAQFDTEGMAAHGSPWQPLTDEYGAWKAQQFPGRPLLVRDGGMKEAMLSRQSAVHVGPTEAVYQPVSRIANFHQSGADWIGPAWGHGEYPHHLPARPMVELSEEFKHEAVDRVFARWISRTLREAGLPVKAAA